MKKRKNIPWKKIILIGGGGALVIAFLCIYFKTNMFTVNTYIVEGVADEQQESVQQALKEVTSQPVYKILPANKVFTYPSSRIQAKVQELLPDTERIQFGFVNLHTIKVVVYPYVPLFRLDEYQAVTKEGFVYPVKNINLPSIEIASSSIISEIRNGLRENKLMLQGATTTERLFTNIATIIPKINTVLFTVGHINVNGYGDIILSDENQTKMVKLSSSIDTEKQWSNVISAVDTEPLKSLLVTKKDYLEYLDVRFGNKVFYKFTNGAGPAIIAPHATSTATTTLR